jgi:hypothetical protein
MWSPSFPPIASLAAGLLSVFQHPFNIGHTTVTELNYTRLDTYTPYIDFARAAYCDPNKIAGWKCGGLSFLWILHLYPFAALLIAK